MKPLANIEEIVNRNWVPSRLRNNKKECATKVAETNRERTCTQHTDTQRDEEIKVAIRQGT